jgi:hypothetical protein
MAVKDLSSKVSPSGLPPQAETSRPPTSGKSGGSGKVVIKTVSAGKRGR